ncbi:MAG: peptidoglycan editing factor PgeF [Pseudomonadota bacterium]
MNAPSRPEDIPEVSLADDLSNVPGIQHGFFSRLGGTSTDIYASLNCGPGSNDDTKNVAANREICAQFLGVNGTHLVTGHQHHSSDGVRVDAPWPIDGAPKCDALVTDRPGIALGVLAADCMPFLFVDPDRQVIGAAHAGWRGALGGVLENTILLMENLGADRSKTVAAVGPCLRPPHFQVGDDLRDQFIEKYPQADQFFAPEETPGKYQLDLVAFGRWRLSENGVLQLSDIGRCTMAEPETYFSYRYSRRQSEPDYGRNLSAIALV